MEHLPFEQVDYWQELCRIMEWSKTHVHSTLHICWGAQAGLYYHYGVPKRALPEKLFCVFRHTVEEPNFMLFRGFDDEFWVPHSRNTTILREDIEKVPELKIMSCSEKAGVYAVKTRDGKQVFLMGHAEYDRDTLLREYLRDVAANVPIHVPEHYFPNDDASRTPLVTWRSCAHLLYGNWLNYFVYQTVPYDITRIQSGERIRGLNQKHRRKTPSVFLRFIAAAWQCRDRGGESHTEAPYAGNPCGRRGSSGAPC